MAYRRIEIKDDGKNGLILTVILKRLKGNEWTPRLEDLQFLTNVFRRFERATVTTTSEVAASPLYEPRKPTPKRVRFNRKKIWDLRRVKGLDLKEVASKMGCSVKTVTKACRQYEEEELKEKATRVQIPAAAPLPKENVKEIRISPGLPSPKGKAPLEEEVKTASLASSPESETPRFEKMPADMAPQICGYCGNNIVAGDSFIETEGYFYHKKCAETQGT